MRWRNLRRKLTMEPDSNQEEEPSTRCPQKKVCLKSQLDMSPVLGFKVVSREGSRDRSGHWGLAAVAKRVL